MTDKIMVSKNFSQDELACRCGCGVYGILPVFLNKLQELRDRLGKAIVVTSGYRCEKHNRAVGGEPNSFHMYGIAADLHCPDASDRYKLLVHAAAIGFTGIGIDQAFIHVDYRTSEPKCWVYPQTPRSNT